jgi:hypothetical protein
MSLLFFFEGAGGGGGGGYANAFTDLTYAFVKHIAVLRAANPGIDSTTLAAHDIATVRGAATAPGLANMNVAEAEYLLVND